MKNQSKISIKMVDSQPGLGGQHSPDYPLQADFLYECVEETINRIIPQEIDYLEKYDRLTSAINSITNLPDTKVDLLIKVLDQNNGKLSKRKREQTFNELSEEEISMIEENYTDIFEK